MIGFPRDDYRRLERYAPDRRPVAVDLSDNTNRWGPHPAALRVLREATPEGLTRYPSVYADELRAAVARTREVPERCVTTGCGSDDLLDSIFRAASGPGGRVSRAEPTFSMIPIVARMNGLEAVAVPAAEARERPERLLETDPAVVYVCDPNNPTGETLPGGWLDDLLAASGPRGPVVVVDEAYADFAGHSLVQRAPGTDRLVVLRTFSKAYGLAGLRIGYAVGAAEVVAEVEKSRGPYKVGRLDERAAVRALEDADGWLDGIVATTVENRARLIDRLESRGLRPLPTRANFVLVPVEESGARELATRLRQLGVAVRPFPQLPGIGDAVRVTVGPWSELQRFLEALDRIRNGAPAGTEKTGKDEKRTEAS